MVKAKIKQLRTLTTPLPCVCWRYRKETSNALQARYLEGDWNSGLQYLIFGYLAFQGNFQPGSALQVISITILISRHLEKGVLAGLSLLIGNGKQGQLLVSYQELLSSLPRVVLESRMQAVRVMIMLPNFRRLQCRGHWQPRGGTAHLLCFCLLWEEVQCLG